MAESSDDGYEIEKPPERRAPSNRASRGSRMGKLIAEEEEEEGDGDFYAQDFWNEAEGDAEYADQADDEAAGDSFDSDFGDSTASDDDDDDDNEKTAKKTEAKAVRKKSVYKDPKEKKAAAAAKSDISAGPKSHKRQRSGEAAALGAPAERTGRRASTQDHSVAQKARLAQENERAKAREQRRKELGKTKGVIEYRRLTQDEILAEARQTEIINSASLKKMQLIEEEKRKVIVRDRDTGDSARIKWVSKRQGDSVVNTLSFVNCEIPAQISAVAPPYPPLLRCAATGLPAKFFDHVTQQPYATLEAFQRLRGRTGRRSSWPAPNDLAPPPGTPLAAAAPEV